MGSGYGQLFSHGLKSVHFWDHSRNSLIELISKPLQKRATVSANFPSHYQLNLVQNLPEPRNENDLFHFNSFAQQFLINSYYIRSFDDSITIN